LEHLLYFGVAAGCNWAGVVDPFGIYWTVFNACRDFRDTLVALAWWVVLFDISFLRKGVCVFFFSSFVINEKTICFLPNQFLLISSALTGANYSSSQALKH
jgi:hypothetical protein